MGTDEYVFSVGFSKAILIRERADRCWVDHGLVFTFVHHCFAGSAYFRVDWRRSFATGSRVTTIEMYSHKMSYFVVPKVDALT